MTEKTTGTAVQESRGTGIANIMEQNDVFVDFAMEGDSLGLELLRFSGNTGKFTYDQEELPQGTPFVFDVYHVKRGYVCWKDNKMPGSYFETVISGNALPPIEDMEDYGPYSKNSDGWKEAFKITVSSLEGDEMELTLSSVSGCKAIRILVKQYGKARKQQLDETGKEKLPLVLLDSSSFPTKHGGVKYKPIFVIDSWESEANLMAASDTAGEPVEEKQVVDETPKTAESSGVTTPPSSTRGRRLRG